MKINYVLIDYENVQPKSLAALNGNAQAFKVMVFLGSNQTKIPVEFARELQALGNNAEYVQISGNGSNALDFHIAFTMGELSVHAPDAYFHIISKDTGFDPLIKYMKKKGISAQRSREMADIPLLRTANAKTMQEKLEAVVRNLAARGAGRPRKVKTLSNTIKSLFLNALEDADVGGLIEEMKNRGLISVEQENVSYHLPRPGSAT